MRAGGQRGAGSPEHPREPLRTRGGRALHPTPPPPVQNYSSQQPPGRGNHNSQHGPGLGPHLPVCTGSPGLHLPVSPAELQIPVLPSARLRAPSAPPSAASYHRSFQYSQCCPAPSALTYPRSSQCSSRAPSAPRHHSLRLPQLPVPSVPASSQHPPSTQHLLFPLSPAPPPAPTSALGHSSQHAPVLPALQLPVPPVHVDYSSQ